MTRTKLRALAPALAILLGLALVSPALAATAPRNDRLSGGVLLPAPVADAPLAGVNWIDHFDTYATGSQMHGQGDWVGWDNSPAAGALTSSAQARSGPNSVDIVAASDLVHLYSGHTGTWTYTAWQFLPSTLTGETYFIMLNTYNHGGPYNWSVQINFNGGTDTVTNEGASGGTAPIVYDQWVPLVLVIDLVGNTQTVFYNNVLLYSGTWTEEVSGGGTATISAVDLFANGATSAFYDDISMSDMDFLDGFESGDTREWHLTIP